MNSQEALTEQQPLICGWLLKKGANAASGLKLRYFFLSIFPKERPEIRYFKEGIAGCFPLNRDTITSPAAKAHQQGSVPLTRVTVTHESPGIVRRVSVPNDGGADASMISFRCPFLLDCQNDNIRAFYLVAADAQQRTEWMAFIRRAVVHLMMLESPGQPGRERFASMALARTSGCSFVLRCDDKSQLLSYNDKSNPDFAPIGQACLLQYVRVHLCAEFGNALGWKAALQKASLVVFTTVQAGAGQAQFCSYFQDACQWEKQFSISSGLTQKGVLEMNINWSAAGKGDRVIYYTPAFCGEEVSFTTHVQLCPDEDFSSLMSSVMSQRVSCFEKVPMLVGAIPFIAQGKHLQKAMQVLNTLAAESSNNTKIESKSLVFESPVFGRKRTFPPGKYVVVTHSRFNEEDFVKSFRLDNADCLRHIQTKEEYHHSYFVIESKIEEVPTHANFLVAFGLSEKLQGFEFALDPPPTGGIKFLDQLAELSRSALDHSLLRRYADDAEHRSSATLKPKDVSKLMSVDMRNLLEKIRENPKFFESQ